MSDRGRKRTIDAVNEVTGRNDCSEAVVLQRRPVWLVPVAAIGFAIVLAALGSTQLGSIPAGAIGGGLMGLVLALGTDNFLIGRSANDVILARSAKLSIKGLTILSEQPAPVQAVIGKGILTKKILLNGQSYTINNQLLGRFQRVVA